MRETKDQTIARLEKVINEQKKELTEVKKERKRLKYAVERLEKEKKKALITSTPYDIELICSCTDELQEQKKQVEELKATLAEKENNIQVLRDRYTKERENAANIRKGVFDDLQAYIDGAKWGVIQKINEFRVPKYGKRTYMEHFQNGDRYYDYEFEGYETHILEAMFDPKTLFIRINPKNGRLMEEDIDKMNMREYLKNIWDYIEAKKALEEFMKTNPTNDEIVEWTYKKGMELLPKYEDILF
ncbi:hypothetical protein SAMN05444349_11479 [Bacteroides faecichinchillae]|uniref:Uncharacterized protein n=1 Tax=Bacteroides faecichinchillae TaxID=871325 RepID=A0A1M5A6F8_9BACE|nr:hypothetical protein [Bacteroides faecichinchillae]THG68488.1 hypothetical protein E5981_04925 [Bacteroides faecichinchillae]SHF25755.1 hypothetical protein SAMN05444349_11479 [Bacteroides faecichinchillae]